MTPRNFSRASLAALEASEGRRKMRKRDQTPDAIGLGLKRQLLERVVQADPPPEAFEAWLLRYVQDDEAGQAPGATSTARAVLEEWRLAHAMPEFAAWLERGAPSEDAPVRAPAGAPFSAPR